MAIQLPEALNGNRIEMFNKKQAQEKQLPVLKEWAYDFQRNELLLNDSGSPYLVERNEALKIWIFWAVITEKKQWLANSRTYGAEIEHMIGLPTTTWIRTSEIKRTITEALEQCPYIKSVERVAISIDDDIAVIDVAVKSIYADKVVTMNVKI